MEDCTGLTGNNAACLSGDSTCASAVESPIEEANNFNVYDVLEPRSAESTDPPETYVDYLQSSSVMTAIGAQTTYGECPTGPYTKMVATGDGRCSRNPEDCFCLSIMTNNCLQINRSSIVP